MYYQVAHAKPNRCLLSADPRHSEVTPPDNKVNIVAANKSGQWRSVACFAHALNPIVPKGLGRISELITQIYAFTQTPDGETDGHGPIDSASDPQKNIYT